jgi:tRNA modification GTPase
MRAKQQSVWALSLRLMRFSLLIKGRNAFCRPLTTLTSASPAFLNPRYNGQRALPTVSTPRYVCSGIESSTRVFHSATSQDEDTIFALSSGFTGQQATAVAVLRISGSKAHQILDAITKSKLPPARMAVLRKLYSPEERQMLDHALCIMFEGPNSFTGEDLVELHCHGSRAVVQGMLDILPTLGCRLAEPGEFTQRAFGKGKLDLVQVEALADILGADTQAQLKQALSQLDGNLSKVYEDWRSRLISGLAHAEAVIDFGDDERLGEDDILDDDSEQWNVWGSVEQRMDELSRSMKSHLRDERKGELVREGVKIAIIGPPNAGKSSLFNLLSKKDAAIVSPIAGTTRDVLQVSMDLGGVKCTLQDTAGVRRDTTDILEMEGIKRAVSVAAQADLVVAMVDGSNATEKSAGLDSVKSILTEYKVSSSMLVVNKCDIMDESVVPNNYNFGDFGKSYEVSCVTQVGVDGFLEALTQTVLKRTQDDSGGEGAVITRARHRQHVEAAAEALERFKVLSRQGPLAVDMAAEELRLAASELGRITGAVDVEDVLDVLFADFCIGK